MIGCICLKYYMLRHIVQLYRTSISAQFIFSVSKYVCVPGNYYENITTLKISIVLNFHIFFCILKPNFRQNVFLSNFAIQACKIRCFSIKFTFPFHTVLLLSKIDWWKIIIFCPYLMITQQLSRIQTTICNLQKRFCGSCSCFPNNEIINRFEIMMDNLDCFVVFFVGNSIY